MDLEDIIEYAPEQTTMAGQRGLESPSANKENEALDYADIIEFDDSDETDVYGPLSPVIDVMSADIIEFDESDVIGVDEPLSPVIDVMSVIIPTNAVPQGEQSLQAVGKPLRDSNGLYRCHICGRGYKIASSVKRHMASHDPNGRHKCQICGRVFEQATTLQQHTNAHYNFKPHKCEVCGLALTQQSGLNRHMLIHKEEYPHKCDACGLFIRYSNALNRHQLYYCSKRNVCVVLD